ncbi:hypothetical protein JM946_13960 [Steroidobacter sp. S1-65]|uniref:Condensation domain-containing protein n=1 Tax=Steroidobacter gossypii TaxID=2805490 RepID=A0ABS1WXY6_9GAMM|nr:condensation domain-containing protein [Steroidobacter gossypii]MBM0105840.1 hypothetical protein [Steroidobacter gossypii]
MSFNESHAKEGIRTLDYIRSKGVILWTKNGRLHFRAPKGVLTPDDVERLRDASGQIIATLERLSKAADADTEIHPRVRFERAPVSFSQLAYWNVAQLARRPSVRHLAAATRLQGQLDLGLLHQSLGRMIQRHEALRTRVVVVDDMPVQHIDREIECQIRIIDLSAAPRADQDHLIKSRVHQLMLEPVDVTKGPLFIVGLLKLARDEHVLVVAMEHLISDAKSVGILMRDLLAAYVCLANREEPGLPSLPVQFADYATWLQDIYRPCIERRAEEWTRHLHGCPTLEFPEADAVDPSAGGWGATPVEIPLHMKERLLQWSRSKGTTVVMAVLVVYVATLLCWCRAEQTVVRYQTDGRFNSKVQHAIGYFATVLYLRVCVTDSTSFSELLSRVTREYCAAHEHADFSYIDAQLPRLESASAPTFNWVPQSASTFNATSPLICSPIEFPAPALDGPKDERDPALLLYEGPSDISGSLLFPRHRFSEASMRQFVRTFMLLLGGLLRDEDRPIRGFPLQ